jgi:hypothetical protein
MADIATISAALGSLKTAIGIAKFLGESDLSLEKAELKLKLAELIAALADAKMEVADVQDALVEKDKRIAELEEAFEVTHKVVRHKDAYYASDDGGNPVGVPYCLRCWENDHKLRQLKRIHPKRVCTTCHETYDTWRAEDIPSAEKAKSG